MIIDLCVFFSCFSNSSLTRRAIGKKHIIPEATLRLKLKGVRPEEYVLPKRRGIGLITDAKEQLLFNWIEGCHRRAMPMDKDIILKALEDILQKEEEEFPR